MSRRRAVDGMSAPGGVMASSRIFAGMLVLAFAPACGDPGAPATAASLDFIAGSTSGTVGHALQEGPAVVVRDAAGAAIPRARVAFTVVAGDGFVADSIVESDGAGRASVRWILGPDPGAVQRLRASADGVAVDFDARAQPAVAGQPYFGRHQYIEYVAGDLPIIITAPHGGTLRPASIRERTTGTLVSDANTMELARAITAAFEMQTVGRPHLIICRLHRTRLDANRDIGEAAQGNAEAVLAWREFHAYTEAAKQAVVMTHERGLYIDLHGHGHAIARLELGYMLTAADLALGDQAIGQPAIIDRSTIRTLARSTDAGFAELLRGAKSLGGLFAGHGYAAVPSPAVPGPGTDDYFTGGYNVARHGSRAGGAIDGVQIETQFPGVRDTEANRTRFASALAASVIEFFATHYGFDLPVQRAGRIVPRPQPPETPP